MFKQLNLKRSDDKIIIKSNEVTHNDTVKRNSSGLVIQHNSPKKTNTYSFVLSKSEPRAIINKTNKPQKKYSQSHDSSDEVHLMRRKFSETQQKIRKKQRQQQLKSISLSFDENSSTSTEQYSAASQDEQEQILNCKKENNNIYRNNCYDFSQSFCDKVNRKILLNQQNSHANNKTCHRNHNKLFPNPSSPQQQPGSDIQSRGEHSPPATDDIDIELEFNDSFI